MISQNLFRTTKKPHKELSIQVDDPQSSPDTYSFDTDFVKSTKLLLSSAVKSPAFTKKESPKKHSLFAGNNFGESGSIFESFGKCGSDKYNLRSKENLSEEEMVRKIQANSARQTLLHRLRVKDMSAKLLVSKERPSLFGIDPGYRHVDLVNCFSEENLLSKSERQVRQIARTHCLPLAMVEDLKNCFDDFDKNQTGRIEINQFREVMLTLLKIKNPSDMPAHRVTALWQMVDLDSAGSIDFIRFLEWYLRYFYNGEGSDKSPIQIFYGKLGTGRFSNLKIG
eukprot:gene1044-996_t